MIKEREDAVEAYNGILSKQEKNTDKQSTYDGILAEVNLKLLEQEKEISKTLLLIYIIFKFGLEKS